jgi:hypothetical protein
MRPRFTESHPAQADLFLQHVSAHDLCEAYISSQVSFNIRPVAELYAHVYGEYDDIVLNVFGYFDDEPAGKISVTYSPR